MARIAWALLFVVLLGVCTVLAPGRDPIPPLLEIPPAPVKTTPVQRLPRTPRRSPAMRSTPAPVIGSRSTSSTVARVLAPAPSAATASASTSRSALPRLASVAPVASVAPAPLAPVAPVAPLAPTAKRPTPLVPLYVSFATIQALDYHSTRRAVAGGSAYEANPLMRSIVRNPPAFIAVKAAATAGVIIVGEKLWKKNRTGAVLFVAGTTAALGVVVGRNYSVR